MKVLGQYINGNYHVTILSDGTKIRETINPNDNFFVVDKPESMDIKITNQCDVGCPACHEDSTPYGKHGDILNLKFIETLQPYSELAIGGGNPLSHPDLIEFLKKLKSLNVIANITVNQTHFLGNQALIKSLVEEGLIHGLGVSLQKCTDELLSYIDQYPNLVFHIINGIVDIEDLERMSDRGAKVLILGYKQIRRGRDYYSQEVRDKQALLYDYLPSMLSKFDVVSFDNLAIKQLEVKRLLGEQEWNEFYMGDDGEFTMYCDVVNWEFAKSSVSPIRYGIMNDVGEMFRIIKRDIKECDGQ